MLNWLSWLAGKLTTHDQSLYFIENMQLIRVEKNKQLQYIFLRVLSFSGAIALLASIVFGQIVGVKGGVIFGVAIGLGLATYILSITNKGMFFYLLFGKKLEKSVEISHTISTVDTIHWDLKTVMQDRANSVTFGSVILFFGIVGRNNYGLAESVIAGVGIGGAFLISGMISGLNVKPIYQPLFAGQKLF